MNCFKKVAVWICFFLSGKAVVAQFTDKYKFNNVPTSPEAAAFSRFGDIPISYYTGTANVSIPIYTIKEAGLEIPIVLNYHGSGIKVADEATWVGLGWDLSPGGMIVQEVRGKKDDDDNNLDRTQFPNTYNVFKSHLGPIGSGIYYSVGQTGDCLKHVERVAVCDPTWCDAENILYRLQEGGGQPDIYSFNVGGMSGKFYINPETQAIVQMDKKQDILIEKVGGMKITNLEGDKYYFQTIETSQGYTNSDIRGVTYRLSSITLHNGKEVKFTYADETTYNYFERESKVLIDFGGGSGVNKTTDFVTNYKKTLTKITCGEVTINFNLEARDDIDGVSPKRLASIDIVSNISNTKIKSYQFNYSYFPFNYIGATSNGAGGLDDYTANHINAYGHRLKLDSLKEIGYLNNNPVSLVPPYKFEYDLSNTLPFKNSYATDFWGYYNGQSNTRILPDLNYFDYGNDAKYRDTFPLMYGYIGANRYANGDYASTYLLKKIQYPTGGKTEFEYEPNSFSNQYVPDQNQVFLASKIGNIIDNNDGISATSTTFNFSKSQAVTFQNTITGYNVNRTAWDYTEMLGCYIVFVKQKMVSGVMHFDTLKRWDLSTVLNADFTPTHSKTWNDVVKVPFDNDPGVSYAVRCYMPDNLNWVQNYYHSASVKAYFTYTDNLGVDTTITNQGGARIKSIKNYTDSGVLASNKRIFYFGGKLLNKFEPLETYNAMHNNYVNPDTYTTYYKRITISGDDFGTGGGNLIGYDSVQEVQLNIDATDNIGKRTYSYINTVNQTSKGFPNSPYLKNGFISKEVVFDKLANKLLETDYLYTNLQSFSCYSGIRIKNNMFGNIDDPGFLPYYNPYVGPFNYKFSFWMYPLLSEWNMLQSKTTRQYSGANYLTSAETYTYNTKGQLISTTSTNSKQQSTVLTTNYPADFPSDPASAILAATNRYSSPINIISTINSNEVARVHYNYGSVPYNSGSTRFVNSSIQKSFNQGSLFTDVTFNKITENENVRTYTQNNVSNSLLWSDSNSYVIAEATNASDDWIAFTSFEENAKGKWTFANGSVSTSSTAFTGSKIYNIAGGLTGPVLSASQPCIVSYWRNSNSGPFTVTGTQGTPMTGPTRNGWTYYEHKVVSSSAVTVSGTGSIDEVRLFPQNARMISYTYQPLTGVTSKNDPANSIAYYEYDAHGRLALVRDQDRNILKKICYNYTGQQVNCSGTCSDTTANWQNITDSVRCQQGSCGNTGYQEQKQRNINSCSPGYNNTRWVVGSNPSACSANGVSIVYDNSSFVAGYTAVYTNGANTYTFSIPASGTGVLGCIPAGVYTLTISKSSGRDVLIEIGNGCVLVTGSSATMTTNVSSCNQVHLGTGF